MPNETFVWLTRIREVEREYNSAQWATKYVVQAAQADPSILALDLRIRDIRNASDRLQGTYIIRLFAQFETALRAFIAAQAKPQPKWAEQLINRVGNLGKIPPDMREKAHTVRKFRNSLVHVNAEAVEPLTMREATSRLCTFLDPLKKMW